ncbi:MAG: Co2+/Mg2+ efflux protein ApaG [Cytophagaceae bacterium]|nr:Co2+/Mg2+ efflux protein ApaG [Cytophagaceae bacterium]
MVTAVTEGIKVSVRTAYQSTHSNPVANHYFFSYTISIENQSDYTVKLLRRHWFIFDSNGQYREVEGPGVVGQTPVLEPGERYEYTSGCNLKTDIGKMEGNYLMQREVDQSTFQVEIPAFLMILPQRLN